MSLPKLDRIDRFGHCVICAENLLVKRVVDGKLIEMFKPIYDHTFFLLNTASQMQVTVCKVCKEKFDLNDPEIQKDIMAACYKGWELETKIKVDEKEEPWTEELRDKLLDERVKLSIDCHSEPLDKAVVQARQFELLKFKVKNIEEAQIVPN